LTPSAVSQQLAILEREAGTELLDRSPRGVRLTGAGHALVDRAQAILHLLEQARADLDLLAGELAGRVRIGTVASAGAAIVSPAAIALREEHPELDLSVLVVEPSHSIEQVAAGDLDLAVIDVYDGVPVPLPDHLVTTELVTEPLVVVSRPGTFKPKRAVRLSDLADADWVLPPLDAACGQAVRFACRAGGFEPSVRWETDDMLLLARAVGAGHGVAVLPRLAVDEAVADVAVNRLAEPALTRRLIALTRVSSQSRSVVRATLEALQKAAAGR
jgi:DNA-binding transcriptional LysR family regulator